MPVDELNRALFGLVVVRDGDTVLPSTPARTTPDQSGLRAVV
jgi:hypothetical protein